MSPTEILARMETAGRTSWTASEVREIVSDEYLSDDVRASLLRYADSL